MSISPDHEYMTLTCTCCGSPTNVPIYCGNRFCPDCSQSRARRVRARLEYIIKQRRPAPGYTFKHLVLTIHNSSSAALGCAFILKSFRKLRSRAHWKRIVSGGAFVIEITGEKARYHCHLHIIIESKYFHRDTFIAYWRHITGARGVYVREIPVRSIVKYLTKYITKAIDVDECLDDLNAALKGKRLFNPFGSWYSTGLDFTPIPVRCRTCGGQWYLPVSVTSSTKWLYKDARRAAGRVEGFG